MQKLKIYQSLWAMELRRPDGFEWTDDERFKMIAEAGYDGVCLDPAVYEIDENLAKKHLFEKYGLGCMVNLFPKTDDELRRLLQFSKDMNATTISIIGTVYPVNAALAIPIIRNWIKIARDMGVDVMFETHRDCITNDMFMTLELIEALPEMRLCADFSHYVLNRELSLPMSEDFKRQFAALTHRSDCFQGRIASREQIQVPIAFPQHSEWVGLFKQFWTDGFKSWRSRNDSDAELVFLCELGPPHYAMTDAEGNELSDRWEEALIIKGWVSEMWDSS
ncbi:MAG: sugar phosphate isomerase/epimerase [Hellea sp.]